MRSASSVARASTICLRGVLAGALIVVIPTCALPDVHEAREPSLALPEAYAVLFIPSTRAFAGTIEHTRWGCIDEAHDSERGGGDDEHEVGVEDVTAQRPCGARPTAITVTCTVAEVTASAVAATARLTCVGAPRTPTDDPTIIDLVRLDLATHTLRGTTDGLYDAERLEHSTEAARWMRRVPEAAEVWWPADDGDDARYADGRSLWVAGDAWCVEHGWSMVSRQGGEDVVCVRPGVGVIGGRVERRDGVSIEVITWGTVPEPS